MTRIEKYKKIREQVQKDIKFLKIKEEKLGKIKKMKELLNKIDKKIFEESQLEANKIFPNLKSFLKIEKEKEITELNKTKKTINEWQEKINKIKNVKKKTKITEYVPYLENESLIKNNIFSIKKDKTEIPYKFKYIKSKKENIIENSKKVNKIELENINLQNIIKKNNISLEQYKKVIQKITNIKKTKTKWLLNFLFVLLIGEIICLILIISLH